MPLLSIITATHTQPTNYLDQTAASIADQELPAGCACAYLELEEGRAWRWRRNRQNGTLEDAKPGGAVHGLRPEEVQVTGSTQHDLSRTGSDVMSAPHAAGVPCGRACCGHADRSASGH